MCASLSLTVSAGDSLCHEEVALYLLTVTPSRQLAWLAHSEHTQNLFESTFGSTQTQRGLTWAESGRGRHHQHLNVCARVRLCGAQNANEKLCGELRATVRQRTNEAFR